MPDLPVIVFAILYLYGGHTTWQLFLLGPVRDADQALLRWGDHTGHLPTLVVKAVFLMTWPLWLVAGHVLAMMAPAADRN